MADTAPQTNPILVAFDTDVERAEPWIVVEYLTALDEYQNHSEREFDEDAELRLATYHRVSRCGASPEEVQHAITVLTRLESWAATPIRYRSAGEQLRAAAGRLGAHITPRHDEDGTVHIDAEQVLTLTVVVTRMALSSRDGTKAYTLLGAMRPREATLSLSAHQVTQLTDALNRIAVAAEQDRARRHSSWAK